MLVIINSLIVIAKYQDDEVNGDASSADKESIFEDEILIMKYYQVIQAVKRPQK